MNFDDNPPTPISLILKIEECDGPINVRQLAGIMFRSIDTIYRQVRLGRYPFYRIGGMIVFDPATLSHYFRKKYPAMAEAAARIRRNNKTELNNAQEEEEKKKSKNN